MNPASTTNPGPATDPAPPQYVPDLRTQHSTAPTDGARVGSGPANHAWTNAGLGQWLVSRRNDGVTPDEIAAELVTSGWDADAAARTSLRSLRSSDRQTLTYGTLNLAAGLAALGTATSAHLLIAGNPRPVELTLMLTLALVTAPIAVVAAVAARRTEARSTFVMWSPSRRGWFGALAFCTGAVGIVRLLTYLFSALATLTGASDRPFTVGSASQVAVSLMVSIPTFVWSFREWRRSNLVISALSADEQR